VLACAAPAGHLSSGGDCDDTRADVSPAGVEVCDEAGADEDCDGLANDDDASVGGQATFYADADADGYGAVGGVVACFQPEGHVLETGDCDDARADVSPAGAEVCDEANADEDCDGAADDADDSATGQLGWYPDADADGWGGEASVLRCDGLVAETTNAGDCDDTDPALNGDDRDGDGESACDGDCDDEDADTTSANCSYTSMAGVFDLGDPICSWDVEGPALDAPVYCLDCEFAFESDFSSTAGDCLSSFVAELGWDEDDQQLSFFFSGNDLGPFDGAITTGAGYDILDWYGVSGYGFDYSGTFFLYR
jgi:hypothetical protein